VKSRKRSVTFRLSLDEFELVKRVTLATGSRSVSDFTREAVLERAMISHDKNLSLSTDLRRLSARLQALDNVLNDTRQQIVRILGSEKADHKTSEQ
jgi:uncharacterized protein (DUF1778 family)